MSDEPLRIADDPTRPEELRDVFAKAAKDHPPGLDFEGGLTSLENNLYAAHGLPPPHGPAGNGAGGGGGPTARSINVGKIAGSALVAGGVVVALVFLNAPSPPRGHIDDVKGIFADAAMVDSSPDPAEQVDASSQGAPKGPSGAASVENINPANTAPTTTGDVPSTLRNADGARHRPSPAAAPQLVVPRDSGAAQDDSTDPESSQLGAIQSASPEGVLTLVDVGNQLYPDGTHFGDREFYAIRALLVLDRRQEAVTRANALLTRFPDGTTAEHVKQLVWGRQDGGAR